MKSKLFFAIAFVLITTCSFTQTQVAFYTTKGSFIVRLEDAKRPITTTNFLKLVKKKFYDKIIFHRVIKDFMIQGGDPTGTGSGGSGVTIKDEFTPPFSNAQKVISMANSGPNSGTSQFFINLVNNAYLDSKHSAFGTVISNFSVVQAIGLVPTNSNDRPLTDVVMDSVRIIISSGIDEPDEASSNIEIFPDPITDESVARINSSSNHPADISIYNQLGEKMYSGKKNLSTGSNSISFGEIQTSNYPQGLYYLLVTDEQSISRHKFIITR